MTTTTNDLPVAATQASHAYQDWLVAQRLPDWLRSASVEQLRELGEAWTLSLHFSQLAHGLMAGCQGIEAFALPRLQWAMDEAWGKGYDARRLELRWGEREPVITAQPIGYPVTRPVYRRMPVLAAALKNFTEEQAGDDGQLAGNALVDPDDDARELPSAVAFAALCRTLDLGGRYQRYLDSRLPNAGQTDPQPSVQYPQMVSLLARAHRYSMLADAHAALIKGHVSEAEHQLLVRLCGLHQPLTLEGRPVMTKQLMLLGCAMQQITVLDVRDETYSPFYSSSNRVLVHIPGDPHAPWQAHVDLRHFANALGKHLRTPAYQRFFARFVLRRDSQAFFSAVIDCYRGLSDLANADLQERMYSYSAPLFDKLALAKVRQFKDDAAMIAVPTAAVDLAVQQAHDQRLQAEGWALLTLAGLFVPALGLAMLTISAWQMLGEVFYGVEAWHEGDRAEALEHLSNVAIDVALLAATAAGVSVARRAWARSAWVDGLLPTQLGDGSQRLWQADLASFESPRPPMQAVRDEQGVHRLGNEQWVEMEGRYYPVQQSAEDGNWRLRARTGHAPLLCHNGAGAWRLWSDHPAEWTDTPRMFRRLGGVFGQLDDRQIDLVMFAHEMDDGQLRALHAYGHAPDAELVDSVTRFAIDRQLNDLIATLDDGRVTHDAEAMRHLLALAEGTMPDDQGLAELAQLRRPSLFRALYESAQPSETADMAQLRRQFPGLHRLAARQLLANASSAERQALRTQRRVPLRLATAARSSIRRIRLVRALEGLYLDTPQTADTARIALCLSARLPGAPLGIRWRLFEGSLEGPLLVEEGAEGSTRSLNLLHLDGQFQLFDAGNHSLAGPGDLFEVMAVAYDQHQRQVMGLGHPFAANLRALLGALAGQQRPQLARMLGQVPAPGWFLPPQRLASGRLGYPLSGRGRGTARSLNARVRAIYPTLDDAQIDTWLTQVRAAGLEVETELARLNSELATLNTALQDWSGRGADRAQRADRRSLASGLQACWQRRAARAGGALPVAYRLTIRNLELDDLPVLPQTISFSHVRELSLMAIGISNVPQGFLRAFPNINILELAGNRLSRLPTDLDSLSQLRELDLFDNQIVLDAQQCRLISRCTHLQYINLSYNPLGRAFTVHSMPQLRRLLLRATGLEVIPRGLLASFELELADLRDNRIRVLPSGFFRAPSWVSSHIRLDGNPLVDSDAQRLRAFLAENGWPIDVEPVPSNGAARQRWLDAADSRNRTEQSAMWDELEVYDGCVDFFALLARLVQTAEYQQHSRALAMRMFTMLRAMCEHDTLREELFAQASLPVTCQDSASLAFSGLELRMLVWRARSDAAVGAEQQALLRLARQLWRLDEVDRIAQQDYQARRDEGADPDQIELVLAYRVGLRTQLHLPAQPSDMLFAEVAGVEQTRIDQARDRVLALETPERLSQALVDRDFWREHLLQANGDRFEALDVAFHSRIDQLMEAAAGMPEGDYLAEMNRVQREREVARRSLMLRLTRQAIGDQLAPLEAGQGQ
ncbi:NEL-type E3 ubiquitin ligase domain-containing protein [Pseudomonas sp. BCRC 81390]|uniref:NEL-type E3 ubiquitin ligase domain-containing protein n=1 Tax=Pseudomonas sp. BCRC 81390 TaxID=3054778 RepID=UPI00259696F6|nr:NEL-type E3 ubiquitin ligase domain-containing protein [Pseudomonas sp. BCRC 81390]MDM3886419.1 NEL-type E3 ubiquitin ligase domain-containing protein [Pseudomonas sp. BCRC 81390]